MTIRKPSTAVLPLVAATLLIFTAVASGQKGKRADTPVTSTLMDVGDPSLGANHRIQSDGAGDYVTFSGSKDTVESVLQTSNTCCQDWELDLGASRTRSLLIDLREPVPPNTGAGAPFDWDYVRGRILVRCHIISPTSFAGMTTGQVLECPMVVSFPIPGSTSTYWHLVFSSIGDVQTDSARVECHGVDGAGKCNEWTVTPAGLSNDAVKGVGRLDKVSFKGNTPRESFGYYAFSFSFRVTNP